MDITVQGIYDNDRAMFQHYRRLVELGRQLVVLNVSDPEVIERYKNEDMEFLKTYIRKRVKKAGKKNESKTTKSDSGLSQKTAD